MIMNLLIAYLKSSLSLCLPALAFALVTGLGASASEQSKLSEERIQQIESMIDAMASKNKAPEIVRVPKYDGKAAPLISRGYDWSEQERVLKAIQAVKDDKSDEMWRRLHDHYGDKRYSITLVFDTTANAKNVTVGDICAAMPGPDFDAACIRHFPKVSGWYVFNPASIMSDKKWAGRPLYEQQIAVCEEAIKQFNSLIATEAVHAGANDYRAEEQAHIFTAEEKAKFIEAVNKDIAELKRTKNPVVGPEKPLSIFTSAWELLDAHYAKNVLDAYKNEK
jgi:hypothetical protein